MNFKPLIFQGFEWHMPTNHDYYPRMQELAPHLKEKGINAFWLPPFCKATSSFDVGYGIYDLYDLGEFDQLGQLPTRYGTREELEALLQTFTELGILPIADVVLNHKAGADFTERFHATPVDEENRNEAIGEEREIEAWTGFNFPGREGKYSEFVWHYYHFTGVDYDTIKEEGGIFKISGEGKGWSEGVSRELGNYDYLMFANIDHQHPDVVEELKRWIEWLLESLPIRGLRFDAIKHIDLGFLKDFTQYVGDRELLLFGEYWQHSTQELEHIIGELEERLLLFDVVLHDNFARASKEEGYDLRTLKDGTLLQSHPSHTVTFVDNHDTQPGQSLGSFVEDHFKVQAYAFLLLREEGVPCIFYGDYLGISGEDEREGHQWMIDKLLDLRKQAAGEQTDYFEHPQAIGWLRGGDEEHSPLAVLISSGEGAEIVMDVGEHLSGRTFVDYAEHQEGEVTVTEDGLAAFYVGDGSTSIWGLKE